MPKEKLCGIYCIENIVSRWYDHRNNLKYNRNRIKET